MWGFTVEEASGPSVEIWPDNVVSVDVFLAMATQWRTGMGGAVGLDYVALPHVFDWLGVTRKDRPRVFADLRLMESTALEKMHSDKKKG